MVPVPADRQREASSALQFSMGRILIASATLLCTFHTNSSDGRDATRSTVRLDPFGAAYPGFSVCLRA